eukprot:CAMPEP_0194300102 /NCGR_PEP_ID=MMETSP0169-20130528/61070_1 /TAXON_ID=218684 /ORGANISM="Corethron pennatum, Strain L29A3" /LENGTH=949 /DNA_ID=CAMNT_0039050241 /DNA_START=171 /DNA_END=3018 /DNA_ORIENTATION=+
MKIFKVLPFFLAKAVIAEDSIIDKLEKSDELTTLLTAIEVAGFKNFLDQKRCWWWCDDYTLFAPDNGAFSDLGDDIVTKLTQNKNYLPHLKNLLQYHLVNGRVSSTNIKNGAEVKTLNGESVLTTTNPIKINEAAVIEPFDVSTSNGIIHTIAGVLLPNFATNSIVDIAVTADFTRLVAALELAELDETLADPTATFTVFAPTNAAFEKLDDAGVDLTDKVALTNILLYHVASDVVTGDDLKRKDFVTTVQGSAIQVDFDRTWQWGKGYKEITTLNKLSDNSRVKPFDILASNGIVHVIDTVLTPPEPLGNIVEVASSLDDFSILVQAVVYANLTEALSSSTENGLTVFAPTNDAFEDLLKTLGVDSIEKVPKEDVANILTYHVLGKEVFRRDLEDGSVETLNGQDIDVNVWGWGHWFYVSLNEDTTVTGFDVKAKGGCGKYSDIPCFGEESIKEDLEDGSVKTLNGQDIDVDNTSIRGKPVILNGNTRITGFDVMASNGVIHVIDSVLQPLGNIVEVASSLPDFSILVQAVVYADLAEALSSSSENGLTVFAPTNDAFGDLLVKLGVDSIEKVPKEAVADILLYHVLAKEVFKYDLREGSVETLNGQDIDVDNTSIRGKPVILNGNTRITGFDVMASNGVIHVIDSVLQPLGNIVEVASSLPDFSILVQAVVYADLAEALSSSSENGLTVFAPTNDAFGDLLVKLGVDSIEKVPKEAVADILLYHVLAKEVFKYDLREGSVETLNGQDIDVDVRGWGHKRYVSLNEDTEVTVFDVKASNGVIHVIDTVLAPPGPLGNIVEVASSLDDFSILVQAVVYANLTEALSLSTENGLTVFAPTNDAFEDFLEKLQVDSIEDVPKEVVADVLTYHVLGKEAFKDDLKDGSVEALNGKTIDVDVQFFGREVLLNEDTRVTVFDVEASNGVIHVIDSVLQPRGNIVEVASSLDDFS